LRFPVIIPILPSQHQPEHTTMEDILEKVRDAVDAPIDFEGQKLATLVNYAVLSSFGVLSFLIGYSTDNVYNCVWTALAGAVVALVAVVPPWPMYNRSPVQWLPARKINGYWVENPDSKKAS